MSRMGAGADYHRYLAEAPGSEPWGVAVTAAGRQVCKPGAAYPPPGHPPDHALSWTKGRVLGACQVVFITTGRGKFESRATGPKAVEPGTALIVLPGVWHRYMPDPATGWVEHWVELRGSVVGNLQHVGVLAPEKAVVRVERTLEMESFFEAIHARLGLETALVCDPERAALGMQILALVGGEDQRGTGTRSITVLVGRAERLMAASLADPPSIPEIARELGAAYSHFRREFKRHTGLSPHRYINKMRLEKARRLMGVTENPLKSIADSLGFSSQYHFSSAFKRQFGVSPKAWRESGTAGGG